ncbi:MAG: MGDG synthase family glycosyltransferase [Candidatus Omnitrophota bacterium]
MKILIAYATAGAGHKKCAEAIADALKKTTGHEVSCVDCLDYTFWLFKLAYSKGYAMLARYLPVLWNALFKFSNNRLFFAVTQKLRWLGIRIFARHFIRFLLDEQFTCCICTQFFPNEVITGLKIRSLIKSRLVCVVTDYNVHRIWVADGVDTYVVACRETNQRLLDWGVKESQIAVLGIPVGSQFSIPLSAALVRKKMGLDENRFTILALTGVFGLGPLEQIVRYFQERLQILVVCGENRRLFSRLNRIKNHRVRVFGMTDKVDELMSAADLVITKPGGLTISEALIKGVPMIFISSIPGQETQNAALMVKYGVACWAKDLAGLKNLLVDLLLDRNRLAFMRANTRRLSKPFAVREIVSLITHPK